MPIALTPDETWKFQLEDDYLEKPELDDKGNVVKKGKPDPAGTWWTLQALPAYIETRIQNMLEGEIGKDGKTVVRYNRCDVDELILVNGIASVENWKTATGSDVPLKRRKEANGRMVLEQSVLNFIAHKHRLQLANAITERTKVSADEMD